MMSYSMMCTDVLFNDVVDVLYKDVLFEDV